MFKFLIKKLRKLKDINFGNTFNISCSQGWIGLIVFFTLLNLGLGIFNLYLYVRIDNNQAFIIDDNQSEELNFGQINKDKLVKTINSFNKKSEEFESLKNTRMDDIVDPSI